jgi:hypothetical protein
VGCRCARSAALVGATLLFSLAKLGDAVALAAAAVRE